MTRAEAIARDRAGGAAGAPWWRRAVIYQVYIRSFMDADGDGIGDIAGIRRRLSYLRDLGVDAIWITPWYPSPMADGGYDVIDYRAIDPRFGTLDDADALVEDAHRLGLRVLLDLVPNHTSDRHPWFQAALRAAPGSDARARYVFADGRGPDGARPPNNWPSVFGGPAWTRVTEADGRPGQWYLHLFAPEQPDLDWTHPAVREEFASILAFWFERGVDGFRIDVAHAMTKAPGLPDLLPEVLAGAPAEPGTHPYWGRAATREIHRAWRAFADRWDGRVLLGEVGIDDPVELSAFLRPGGLDAAFNFGFMASSWDAGPLEANIRATLRAHRRVGAPASWVLSNHDAMRHLTRFGRPATHRRHDEPAGPIETDLELGARRARAATLLMLALPGAVYLYQGEELGLPEVLDLPPETWDDPVWFRSEGSIRGRDGCRVPLPWSGTVPPFGFGPSRSRPWLPQPEAWARLTAERQAGDAGSMLELYRAALRIRRTHPGLASEQLRWLRGPAGTLHFARGTGRDALRCAVNLSTGEMRLPPSAVVVLASDAVRDRTLPPDTSAWYTLDRDGLRP